MLFKSLFFQHFRNYTEATFQFGDKTNLIVGPNAVGKTNLLEAIFLLSTGKSFRAEKDDQMIQFGESTSHVRGVVRSVLSEGEDIELAAVINKGQGILQKKYSINGVFKRRNTFAGTLTSVLFLPTDLDIVIGQPSMRRRFLDDILEQTDSGYSLALTTYMRALRQRNALLERAQESGIRDEKNFAYWDSLLITNGQVVASRREEFISFINQKRKALFEFQAAYDKSEISVERLAQYKQAERGAGVTLVGPHRDDFFLFVEKPKRLAQGKPSSSEPENVKYFASRGQQRLVVLELKLSQIAYIEKQTGERPVLLLDDIFSELDESYTEKVLEIVNGQQSVITTTDEEFVGDSVFNALRVIELGKNT